MSLTSVPSGERLHIGFFGKRNAGKSSLVNAVTGQELSVVSDTRGTTTDPVYKSMELLPLGPVMIIDTPGFDDEGALGEMRVKRAKQVLNKSDIAILVVDAAEGIGECDKELLGIFKEKEIPHIIVYNKSDTVKEKKPSGENEIYVSALKKENIEQLKEKIGNMIKSSEEKRLLGDLIKPKDIVVLITPIDSAAPKGRMILPQQLAIRDIIDSDAICVVTKESEIEDTFASLSKKPALAVTDSQVFPLADRCTPKDVYLTSFSILMARYKGFLKTAVMGARFIDHLQDGDTILISEGCTHHRRCEDIGTVKLPKWLGNYTKKELQIKTSSGMTFPDDLSEYALVIHCGGCMLTDREVRYRMKCAEDQGVPFTNYGTAIAYMNGILERSLACFPDL